MPVSSDSRIVFRYRSSGGQMLSDGQAGAYWGEQVRAKPEVSISQLTNAGGVSEVSVGQERACAPLFSGLSKAEYQDVVSSARVKTFKRHEVLHVQGDSVRQVLFVISGIIKITTGSSGREVILRLGRPGDVIVEGNPFCSGSYRSTAQVFRPCQALVWDAYTFKLRADRFPILRQNIAEIVGSQLLELEDRFREMATEKVGPRVARQVVRLLGQIGEACPEGMELGLSREELAQMTGTTLFTVSRLFSIWEELGILKARRQAVAICDLPAMQEIATHSEE